jgi:G3E family GTPase
VLIVNKTDMVSADEVAAMERWLRRRQRDRARPQHQLGPSCRWSSC